MTTAEKAAAAALRAALEAIENASLCCVRADCDGDAVIRGLVDANEGLRASLAAVEGRS